MSLKYTPIEPIPEETQRVARAAFPKGNPMMTLHDHLPQLFTNEDFAHLYSRFSQSGYAPWRLMLVLIFQFIENLNDRQTANAVSARIDWKYALALPLTDPGFDFSILCEFRKRLVDHHIQDFAPDGLTQSMRNASMW